MQKNQIYGCDITDTLKQNIVSEVKKLKQIGFKNAINVPIRKRGLSSKGDKNNCHENCYKFANRYGGFILYGFIVFKSQDAPKDKCHLLFHSVWITPEYKAVCLTTSHLECETLIFAPRVAISPSDFFKGTHLALPDFYFDHDNNLKIPTPDYDYSFSDGDTSRYLRENLNFNKLTWQKQKKLIKQIASANLTYKRSKNKRIEFINKCYSSPFLKNTKPPLYFL